jgi:nicotinamide-nucleotide amidase
LRRANICFWSIVLKIELICSGTELLSGKLNTNAAYIGSKLSDAGFELSAVSDVADRKEEFACALKTAFERSNIIIVTGGLGPTFDDITVETAAVCLGLDICRDEKVLSAINAMFARRGVNPVPKSNEKQADIIRGAKVLENRFGTAPGQMLHFEYKNDGKSLRKTLFLLPGPPREMQPMFDENVAPFLKSYFLRKRRNESVKVFGLSESVVEELIKPVVGAAAFGDSKSVEFAILAGESGVTVKFSVSGSDEMAVDETAGNIKFELENILKEDIYGYGQDELAGVCGKLLSENKKTLACAESCTGGLLSSKITDIAGSSTYFKNSFITYSNESKMKFLFVKEETLAQFGAVSEQTSLEMALGALKVSGADYALSVTGIAGPNGGSKEKPVGLVYITAASGSSSQTVKHMFFGSRTDIKERAANAALDLLRRKIACDAEAKKNKKKK